MSNSNNWDSIIRSTSGDIKRLSSVWRFNSIPVSTQETTAEHSYWVTLYSVLVHKEVSGRNFDRLLGTVMLKAAVHDVPECVTGDLVRTFKYATPELKKEVDRAEGILSQKLNPEIRALITVSELLIEDPEINGYVKDVVKVADFMSLFQFMRREALRGNLEIYPFYKRMVSDLEMMILETASHEHKVCPAGMFVFKPSEVYASMAKEACHTSNVCFHRAEELF
jgi:5'-deoxynucleotidase YfbR-like HD superfamily hydrolase